MAEHNQATEQQLSLISDGQNGAGNNAGSTQRLLDASNGVPARAADVSRSGLPDVSLDSRCAQRSASGSAYLGSSFRGPFQGAFSGLAGLFDKIKSLFSGGGGDDENEEGEEKSLAYHDPDDGTGSRGPRSRSRVRGDEAGANTYLANAMSQVPGLGLALSIFKNVSQSAKSGGCDGGNCSSPKKAAARADGPRNQYGSTAQKMLIGMPGYDLNSLFRR